MTPKKLYHHASFLLSAANTNQLPRDEGCEVAFIGRSNVGKSSAVNTITGIKGLARSSKTPGRTQTLNLFRLDDDRRLVDLPGYGYAKVPLQIKQHWQTTVNEYLQTRQCLKGLVLIMDIRHPLKESDQRIVNWAMQCEVPLHILLTKCDKLSHGAAASALREMEKVLQSYPRPITLQLFSSLDRSGLEQIYSILDQWFSS